MRAPQETAQRAAKDYYKSLGQPLSALQLFVADENGKFPWDDGVDPEYSKRQPDLRKLAELAIAANELLRPKKN